MYNFTEARTNEETLEMIDRGDATIAIIAKRISDACDQKDLDSVIGAIQNWLKARIANAIEESQNPQNNDYTKRAFKTTSEYWKGTLSDLEAGIPFYMSNIPNFPSLGGFTVPREINNANTEYMYQEYQPESA